MYKHNKIEDNLYLWLLLSHTPKIGPATLVKLIKHFGSIENIYTQNHATLSSIINPVIAQLIIGQSAQKQANQALEWLNIADNHHIIHMNSDIYPKQLLEMHDAPPVLFLKGNIELLKRNKLAIVGTRHPTEQGIKNAYRFALELSNNNLTVVSGMANGIDKAAHLGALEGKNSTIGVIGTGIDHVYPPGNAKLYEDMLDKNGLLISEFPLNTAPIAYNFPKRNRIIAGLSLGLLVVESALDGGSMISANLANDLGREVMAIPGSIHNPVARGCHKLIKSGAKLVETTNDILEELQFGINKPELPKTDNPILMNMGYEPLNIDSICRILNLDFAQTCAKILELELSGEIINCGGGKYQRIFN
ncbi:MAG: DNA-processing protein DprA [Burkholderiales bacterium]|nr:DNA-processing protein DprA [Burkholderiales bacterium]